MNARNDSAMEADKRFGQGLTILPPVRRPNTRLHTTHIDRYGFDMECDFEYYGAEKQTSTDPGAPAMVVLLTVKVAGVDITTMVECSRDLIDSIEDVIYEQMESA